MASSDQRSISGSHSIPFSSRDSTDAFQDMTAFTPPPENWLIRYPKASAATPNNNQIAKKEDIQHSSKKEQTKKFKVPKENQLDDPCKRYIESSENIPVKSNKSLGTDDHFKSAVCSKNLLKVCEKLMTNKEFFSTSDSHDSIDDDFDAELSLMNEESRMLFYRKKHGNRRNSQSLPASPKMERKNQTPVSHNPYFTVTKQEQRTDSSISFLTNLFGITAIKPNYEAQANLAQKYEATNNNSNASKANNSTFDRGDQQQQQSSSQQKMTPRPHIYREMNIFSPTSM